MDPSYREREQESGQPRYPGLFGNGKGNLNGFSYKQINPETGEEEFCLVIGDKTDCSGTGVYPEGKKTAQPAPPLPTTQKPIGVVQVRKERPWWLPMLGGLGLGLGLGFAAAYLLRR